jgi:release factor glutamine methyltransferase
MTLYEALRSGELLLAQQGISDAATDAWLLLEYVTGMTRTRFLVERMQEMPEEDLTRYQGLLSQRAVHIPLQHLTGTQEFMGLTFHVNEHVLIPRQDTEILVEEALHRLQPGMRVLDLCTGSGCIAISLAKLACGSGQGSDRWKGDPVLPKKKISVDAADISEEALEVAAENVRELQADVRLIHSDLFTELIGAYDMIVSNPPYIRTEVIGTLSEEVRLHEPYGALDGKADGLYFYREIVRQSSTYLKAGGWLLFEIGYDQGKAVSELLGTAGYEEIQVRKDLAGLDRVVMGRRGNKEEIHV